MSTAVRTDRDGFDGEREGVKVINTEETERERDLETRDRDEGHTHKRVRERERWSDFRGSKVVRKKTDRERERKRDLLCECERPFFWRDSPHMQPHQREREIALANVKQAEENLYGRKLYQTRGHWWTARSLCLFQGC